MKCFNAVVRTLTLTVLMGLAGSVVAQQGYPDKPIRFIVPYAPGGTTTPLARLLGQKLTESWGQPVIVDNRPGAGTMIGTDAVAKASPDGYTMLFAGGSLCLIPLLLKAPYDPIKDLAPVATFSRTEFVLVVNSKLPVNDMKEFIAYAKARPGELNYATPGAGGAQHVAHELFNLVTGIKTLHIPYKGASPALTDLLGGQVQMFFSTALTAIPHIKSGRLKALGITGLSHNPGLPNVPTFNELGLSGLDQIGNWFGVMMPAGTPRDIIAKMSTEIGRYSAMPDFKQALINQGLTSFYIDAGQFAAQLQADLVRFNRIIKAANIKIDQ